MKLRSFWLCLFLLMVFCGVRLIGLLRMPLYLDEGIYIFWSKLVSESSDYAYVSMQDGKTPLFMWLVSILNLRFKNFLLSGRLVSVVAGGITVLSWMCLAKKGLKAKWFLLYWFLYLLLPFGFLIERLALTDSLVTALTSLSLVILISIHNEVFYKKCWWKGFLLSFFNGFVLAVAYLAKTSARLVLVAEFGIVIWWVFNDWRKRRLKWGLLMLVCFLISWLFYNELLGYVRVGAYRFWGMIAEKETLMIYSPKEIWWRLNHSFLLSFIYFPLIVQYFWVYMGPIVLFSLVGFWGTVLYKKERAWLWLIIYCIVGIVGIGLSGRVMASRYVFMMAPAVLFLAVLGIRFLTSLPKGRRLTVVLLVLICLVMFSQSLTMMKNPIRAKYATDDQQYYVSGDISAIGLNEVVKYLSKKHAGNLENLLIGVFGTWGIPEGVMTVMADNGIMAEGLDNLNLGVGYKTDDKHINYVYVVGQSDKINTLEEVGEIIFTFERPGGDSAAYLIRIDD